MTLNEVIKKLAKRGYSAHNWIMDQDINGSWYGKIGSNIAIYQQRNGNVIFVDRADGNHMETFKDES